jgi:hypothetical protein
MIASPLLAMRRRTSVPDNLDNELIGAQTLSIRDKNLSFDSRLDNEPNDIRRF